MSIEQDVKSFFQDHDEPPAMSISDVAMFLDVDDAVVRRWARNNDVHRVGPNFALTKADIVNLADDLDDGQLEPAESETDSDGDDDDDEDEDGEEDDDAA
jgi:hypothetical protein